MMTKFLIIISVFLALSLFGGGLFANPQMTARICARTLGSDLSASEFERLTTHLAQLILDGRSHDVGVAQPTMVWLMVPDLIAEKRIELERRYGREKTIQIFKVVQNKVNQVLGGASLVASTSEEAHQTPAAKILIRGSIAPRHLFDVRTPISNIFFQNLPFSPFTGDSRAIVVVSGKDFRFVDLLEPQTIFQSLAKEDFLNAVIPSHRGDLLLVISKNSQIAEVIDRDSGESRYRLGDGKALSFSEAAFSPDDRVIVSRMTGGRVMVWRAEDGKFLFEVKKGTEFFMKKVSFSPDGQKILLVNGDESRIDVWSLDEKKLLFSITVPILKKEGCKLWTDFSPDSQFIIVTGKYISSSLYRSSDGKSVGDLSAKFVSLAGYRLQPGGPMMVGFSLAAHHADLSDFASLDFRFMLKNHEGELSAALFSPDGAFVITETTKGEVKLWKTATGEHLFDLRSKQLGHFQMQAQSSYFSPNSQFVAIDDGEKLEVWSLYNQEIFEDHPMP